MSFATGNQGFDTNGDGKIDSSDYGIQSLCSPTGDLSIPAFLTRGALVRAAPPTNPRFSCFPSAHSPSHPEHAPALLGPLRMRARARSVAPTPHLH